MPKTKQEIIEETTNYYNLSNRGVAEFGACLYRTEKGDMCAVGRCLTETGIEHLVCYELAISKKNFSLFENNFKEEYRGHNVEFWQDLQRFHDSPSHFTDTGLSERGEAQKYILLKKWGETVNE